MSTKEERKIARKLKKLTLCLWAPVFRDENEVKLKPNVIEQVHVIKQKFGEIVEYLQSPDACDMLTINNDDLPEGVSFLDEVLVTNIYTCFELLTKLGGDLDDLDPSLNEEMAEYMMDVRSTPLPSSTPYRD